MGTNPILTNVRARLWLHQVLPPPTSPPIELKHVPFKLCCLGSHHFWKSSGATPQHPHITQKWHKFISDVLTSLSSNADFLGPSASEGNFCLTSGAPGYAWYHSEVSWTSSVWVGLRCKGSVWGLPGLQPSNWIDHPWSAAIPFEQGIKPTLSKEV